MKKASALLVIFLTSIVIIYAQDNYLTFGSTSNETGTCAVKTNDNGYLLLVNGTNIIKTNDLGVQQWSRTISYAMNKIISTNDGGYATIGTTSASPYDCYGCGTTIIVMKFNSTGTLQWVYSKNGAPWAANNKGNDIIQTVNDDFIIAGQIYYPGSAYCAEIQKISSTGTFVWNQVISIGSAKGLYYDGTNIFVTGFGNSHNGYEYNPTYGYSDIFLAKYDLNGNQLFNKFYDYKANTENNLECGTGVFVFSNNDIAVFGFSMSGYGTVNSDLVVIRTDDAGNEIWHTLSDNISSNWYEINYCTDFVITDRQEIAYIRTLPTNQVILKLLDSSNGSQLGSYSLNKFVSGATIGIHSYTNIFTYGTTNIVGEGSNDAILTNTGFCDIITQSIIASPATYVPTGSEILLGPSSTAFFQTWSTGDTTPEISTAISSEYAVMLSYDSFTQCNLSVSTFVSQFDDLLPTPNGPVYATYENSNKLYFGGDFNYVGNVCGYSASVNSSDALFDTEMPRINGKVNCVIPDGSGGWYVGGLFTKAGVYDYNNLVHITSSKTIDVAFAPQPNGEVKSLKLVGNKLYAAGSFTMVGEVSRGYLAQINVADGMASSWDPMVNAAVNSIEVYENKIIAGGEFSSIGGSSRNFLAAVDTVYGQATSWNPSPNQFVNKIVLSGLKLYVAGNYTTIAGSSRNRLSCILLSTEALTSWNPNPDNIVLDILPTGTAIYLAGNFNSVGGQTRNYIAAVNTTAGTALSWNPNADNTVNSLYLDESNIIVGGKFSTIGGQTRNCLARLSTTTSLADSWDPDVHHFKSSTPVVNCISMANGNYYFGGEFYSLGGELRNNVACVDLVSGELSSWDANANNVVRAIYSDENSVYIGGEFTQVNGWVNKNRIAQLDKNTAVATGWNPNSDGTVHALAGKGLYLYVGGEFTNIGNNARPKLAAIKFSDGTSSTFNPSPNGTVRALAVEGDSLFVGGDFTSTSGQTRNRVAGYNLSTSNILSFDPNANNSVNAIATNNNNVFIGGNFSSIAGQSRNNFAIFNMAGSIESANPFYFDNTGINAVVTTDSVVYMGGEYTFYNNNSLNTNNNASAIKNTDQSMSTYWHPEPNNTIRSILISNDKIYLGGDFTEVLSVFQPFFVSVDNYCIATAHIEDPFTSQFCEGDGVYLNADTSSNYSYQWYLNNVQILEADSCSYSPVETGTYTVRITDNLNYGYIFSNGIYVEVDPLADTSLTISGLTEFCGGSVDLVAQTGASYTYQWYKDNNPISGENTNTLSVTETGTYYAEIYNSSACVQNSQEVYINSSYLNPTITAVGDIIFCEGNSLVLSSDQTTGNEWYKDEVPTGITTQNITVTESGTYKTYVNSGSCEGWSEEIIVVVNPLPVSAGTISGNTTVCQGETSLTYTVPVIENSTSYIWTLPTGATGTSTTNSITVDYGISASSSNITVKGNNSCGDGAVSSLAVTVDPLPVEAGTISGNTVVCQGEMSLTYTVPVIENATSYIWTLPTGATGTSNINSITVDYSTSAVSGNITVKGTNSCGDGVESSLSITVNPMVADAGLISGSTNVCQGENSVTYTVPIIENAISYIWNLPTGAIGSSNTNSITVDYSTSAVSGNITVKGTNSCGDGAESSLSITINSLVADAGLISGSTVVCQEENSVIYTVPVIENATSYIWTLPNGATGTSTTNSITVDYGISASSSNFTVKGNNSCGDGAESSLSITVNPLPVEAGTISGSTVACQGETSLTYTVPVIENATSYIWTLPTGATGSSNTNSITVDYSTSAVSGNITVKGTNSCGDGVESSLSITVNPLVADAGLISGSTNVCQGENSVTYTVPIIENATSYIWSLPTGSTGTSNTNSITVDYSTSAVSGNITVKGTNSCGDGVESSLSITVNPMVADAGLISGSTNVCQGENSVTYTVPIIENAISYIWNLPTGAIGSSNTNSITVDYSTSAVSGNITVKGTNSCGDGAESSLSITINSLVADAGLISGSTTVCQGENSVTYTVPVIENTTSYIWSLPTGATGSSNTNSITVDYSVSAVSGNITVKGTNSCGDGAESSLLISVNPLPDAAGTISGNTTVCQGEMSLTYTVPIIENATSYIWSLPTGATGSSNTNSITVDYSVSAVSGDITVKGTNSCGDGVESSLSITVNIIPETPIISQIGNSLQSNAEIGNQWYNQSGILPSETSQVYTPLATGEYYTIVTLSGCSSSSSNVINFIYAGIVENNNFASYNIYPNPNNGLFYMEFSIPFTQEIKIEVLNNLGQQVYAISKSYSSGYNIQTIDLSGLAKGVYLIKNNIGGKLNTNKIAVE